MTVKTTISLTDRHHAYARRLAEEGRHGSLSSVVAAGLEQMIQDEAERDAALSAMEQAIRDRMTMPDEDWHDGVDDLFEGARTKLAGR
ncbi:hypothetical protein [Roseovarius sp.]|jgi:antitoxin ParD1/3/4|uniref:ribbon-helix-helix domain-containing protein n=1 Tax=Roseovarius sp. TaxID=1486281 RepID=UPI00260A7A8A|nr:hypothetical protein [Roseovarius sp.]MDM8165264.1 hypothetical protein [Roseovarius sp.]